MFRYNKLLIVIILLGCFSVVGRAQTSSKSPYSVYGLGDEESQALAGTFGMGDIKYGISSSYNINAANAATFSQILETTFDVGLKVNFITLATSELKQTTYTSNLKNINFVFPVSKRWGMGFGLMPYTSVGYNIEDSETVEGVGKIAYKYQGNGGLNKAYFGNGYTIIKDSLNRLSLGVAASYLFGSLDKERDLIIDDYTSYKTKYINVARFSDFNFDLSMMYNRKIGNTALSIGAVYGLGSNAKTFTKDFVFTYTGAMSVQLKDTILYQLDTGLTTLPLKIGAGASLILNNKLTLAFDYSTTYWSKLKFLEKNINLANRIQYSLGAEYVPDITAVSSIKKITRYRMGLKYANSRLIVNNTNLKEYGMTFGIGVPIIKSQSSTMFNFAIEYGQRGTKNNSLTKEQFTNIVVGFSLTPHKFDRWFVKRRIE